MGKFGITWTMPPDVLAANIERYGERVVVGVKAVAEYMTQQMVDYARENAPWIDRTGNARQSLGKDGPLGRDVMPEFANDVVTIYLTSGMDYGKWLELANSGKYATILPTLELHYNEVTERLREIFR